MEVALAPCSLCLEQCKAPVLVQTINKPFGIKLARRVPIACYCSGASVWELRQGRFKIRQSFESRTTRIACDLANNHGRATRPQIPGTFADYAFPLLESETTGHYSQSEINQPGAGPMSKIGNIFLWHGYGMPEFPHRYIQVNIIEE